MKAFIKALIAKNPSIVPYGKRRYSDIYTSAEGYLTWYLTGEHPLPELTEPITRWPGDEEPTYTVLNGSYANNFLHQHGDLTFKQLQIRRHIAHFIAGNAPEFPPAFSSKSMFKVSFSESIKTPPRRILLVAGQRSRVKYWQRMINQCAAVSGQPGYLQDVMQAQTDWYTKNAIAVLWDEGGASIQKTWHDPLLGTGLKQFLTKAAASHSANVVEYQAIPNRSRIAQLTKLLALHESIIKINAARCLSAIEKLVGHATRREANEPFYAGYWDVFSFCMPVICTHVDDILSLMAKFGKSNHFPLVIIDQQGEDYAPESILPCINMSHNTLYLSGR